MFIFSPPTLVNHKERTRELGLSEIHKVHGKIHNASNKYTCFQKMVLLLQLFRKLQSTKPFSKSQKNSIRKTILCIYLRQKAQEREKESCKKRKNGRRCIAEGTGLEAFKTRRPLRTCSLTKWQNNETKHQPMTTKQTLRSGN